MPDIVVGAIPTTCLGGAPVVLGIDEAGRGPVLGPMVYACAYWPVAEEEEIAAFGFNDSKQLTEARRESLFERMKACGRIGWVTHSITAREISTAMLHRVPVSLNVVSHDAAASLLERVLASGVRVERVFVDTVGDAGVYEAKLRRLFNTGARPWTIDFTVSKKADSLYKTVSAASIAAKVSRDSCLGAWVFEEPALAAVAPPSDAGTAAAARAASTGAEKAAAASSPAAAAAATAAGGGGASLAGEGRVADEDEDDDEDDGPVVSSRRKAAAAAGAGAGADAIAAEALAPSSAPGKRKRDAGGAGEKGKGGAEAEDGVGAGCLPPLHPSSAGSGYPGDKVTVAWMRAHMDPLFGWPSVVRFSWAPARDALDADGVAVKWGEEEGEGQGGGPAQSKLGFFFAASSSAAARAGRSAFSRKRHLEPVTTL